MSWPGQDVARLFEEMGEVEKRTRVTARSSFRLRVQRAAAGTGRVDWKANDIIERLAADLHLRAIVLAQQTPAILTAPVIAKCGASAVIVVFAVIDGTIVPRPVVHLHEGSFQDRVHQDKRMGSEPRYAQFCLGLQRWRRASESV
ncbi:MAG: hypothetical protein NXI27_28930 [Alphaproteobacteria bacterium]|nr:hypothetical protein [Alphaproteobacteria bacterium]